MSFVKRICAVVLAVCLLIPLHTGAVNVSDYMPDRHRKYLEEIIDAVVNYELSYTFEERISSASLEAIMSRVYNDYPEIFHLSNTYSTTFPMGQDDIIISVRFNYKMTKSEYTAVKAELEQWADHIVSLADPSFTEYEYALFLHDYLAATYEYDTTYTIYDIYNFIKKGRGVCQAYTYAYAYLLDRVGIENSYATSDEMNHIWNTVKLDGEWYHVDVTWDDPIGGALGKASHGAFMYSDEGIFSKDDPHYAWKSPYACLSDKYETSPVMDAASSYAFVNGSWYYLLKRDGKVCLYATDDPLKEGDVVAETEGMSWKHRENSSVYVSVHSGFYEHGGYLYFNTPSSVMRYDTVSGKTEIVFTYVGNDGYIYGVSPYLGGDISPKDGMACIRIGTAPSKPLRTILIYTDGSGMDGVDGSGDADCDGSVTLSDVTAALRYIAGWNVYIAKNGADINADGMVGLEDVTAMMKIIAGWQNIL